MAQTIELKKESVIAIEFGDMQILVDSTSGRLTIWTSEEDDNRRSGVLFDIEHD